MTATDLKDIYRKKGEVSPKGISSVIKEKTLPESTSLTQAGK